MIKMIEKLFGCGIETRMYRGFTNNGCVKEDRLAELISILNLTVLCVVNLTMLKDQSNEARRK